MCRNHHNLLEMAEIESLPLRQSFNFRYLQYVTTSLERATSTISQ